MDKFDRNDIDQPAVKLLQMTRCQRSAETIDDWTSADKLPVRANKLIDSPNGGKNYR